MYSRLILPEDIELCKKSHVLPVPICSDSIAINGKPVGTAWSQSAKVKRWKTYMDKLTCHTETMVTWDSEYLYMGFVCQEPFPEKLRYGQTAGIRTRGDLVPILNMRYYRPQFCEDDTVSVFIDAKNDSFSYHHVLVNPVGDSFTSRGWASRVRLESDYNWRCKGLKCKAKTDSNQWSATITIPWKSLGLREVMAGQMIGLDLNRERQAGETPESYHWQIETLAWSTQLSTTLVYQPEMFNKVILGSFSDNINYIVRRIKEDYKVTDHNAVELDEIASSNVSDEKQWRKQLSRLYKLTKRLYEVSFARSWWLSSKPPSPSDMLPGLIDRPASPVPGRCLPKKLDLVTVSDNTSQMSLWATNLNAGAKTSCVELRIQEKIIKPIIAPRVTSGRTERLDFLVDPGTYDVLLEGCCVSKLCVQKRQLPEFTGKAFRPPKPILINGKEFWNLHVPYYEEFDLPKISFLENSGLWMGIMRRYRVAVRQIEVYEPNGGQNIAEYADIFREGQEFWIEPGSEEKKSSEGTATPISGCIILDFGRVCRIDKAVISHGEPFGKTINRRKISFLNIADSFELQYKLGDEWHSITQTNIQNNRKAVTVHKFEPVITRQIRVVIHSQIYSGIEYNKQNAWQWFFEKVRGANDLLAEYNGKCLSSNILSKGKGKTKFEKHLDMTPFILHLYRFNKADEIDAKNDPMFKMALKSLERRFNKTFQGFLIFEWESDQLNTLHGLLEVPRWESYSGMLPAIPRDRKPALELMKKWFDLEQSAISGKGIGVNCYRCGDHWHLAWGSKAAWTETSQSGNPSQRTQLAFQRGAARQFRKPMGFYSAIFLGPGMAMYTEGYKGRVLYDSKSGTSCSMYWRTLIHAYLSGENIIAREGRYMAHLMKAKRGVKLSPHGEVVEHWEQLRKRLGERGAAYTPIAVVLPFEHGWYPSYMTGNSSGVAGGRVVGNGEPYGFADEMVDAFFRTVFGDWVTQRRERHGSLFSHSEFGDLFDVLVLDPPKGKPSLNFLSRYPALIILGSHKFSPDSVKLLVDYASQGGLLVLNEVYKSSFPEHDNIVITSPEWLGAKKGKMDEASRSFLISLCDELSPVKVVGDIHYLINKTTNGWLVGLFNHKGVYKMPKEPEIVIPTEISHVQVTWRGEFYVSEAIKERKWAKPRESINMKIPAGEVRVLMLTRCKKVKNN